MFKGEVDMLFANADGIAKEKTFCIQIEELN